MRTRDRANTSKRERNRPSTARVSNDKKKKNKKANSEIQKKERKKKPKPKGIMPKMSMQDQARQALCITAHKALVQAFIEKTENLAGTINFAQFRQCLQTLDLDVGKGDALKAFSELDEDKEEGRFTPTPFCLYIFICIYDII